MIRLHEDWGTAAFDLPVAAEGTGPFPMRGFLAAWWRARATGHLLLAETDDTLLPLHIEDGVVGFLGEADLTDYHTPLGGDGETAAAALVAALPAGTPVSFDSLPDEVAGPLARGLRHSGLTVSGRQHEAAAVLALPATWDGFLGGLSSKQRHEMRRKARRFTEAFGEPALVRDAEAFASFVRMHRASPGEKGTFMTEEMEAFFSTLLGLQGASLDVLAAADGSPIAAAFGFEDDTAYYLYNSAFDPDAAPASPGAVLVERLIARAIAAGKERLDFLKGDEEYKYRLGAAPRPLYRVTATT